MNQDQIIAKIKETEGEVYQLGRDMDERWHYIEKYIPDGIIWDIGSAQGWFTERMSRDPNRAVISFEFKEWSVKFQQEGFKDRSNVVVCKYMLEQNDFELLTHYVEGIDLVFAMAVLHHFIDPEPILSLWSRLSPKLIIEMPVANELEAYNQAGIRKFYEKDLLNKYYSKVTQIGASRSHLGRYQRPIWFCENEKVERRFLDPYIGYNQVIKQKAHSLWFKEGEWYLGGKRIVKGANVWNLLHYNIVSPEPEWWSSESLSAYLTVKDPTDIRPWNLLYTPKGIVPMDYSDPNPELKATKEDYRKMAVIFNEMKPLDWRLI